MTTQYDEVVLASVNTQHGVVHYCSVREAREVFGATEEAITAALVAQLLEAKRAEIERDRDAEASAPVQALGRTWDADPLSRHLLSSTIVIASTGGPLPHVWRDYLNDNMPVESLDDLKAIAVAMAAQVSAAYARSWQRKAALEAAQTPQEVEAA